MCISKKLGLYISNLPCETDNNWQEALADELEDAVKIDGIKKARFEEKFPCGIINMYKKVFPNKAVPQVFSRKCFETIAEQMICIYFDFEYENMPLGDDKTNCFDERYCEEDCAEKIINLIDFAAREDKDGEMFNFTDRHIAQWIYSTNHDNERNCLIFNGGEPAEEYVKNLQYWGNLFDEFLQTRNDYLLFDFILNAVHNDNGYNEYHFLKDYSLCQLFLEKNSESELDSKLCYFINDECYGDRRVLTKLLRGLRNKIAHGDFEALDSRIEEYTQQFMDEHFDFDYTEYSRRNWTLLSVCCLMDDIVREILRMLFTNRSRLNEIKNTKCMG